VWVEESASEYTYEDESGEEEQSEMIDRTNTGNTGPSR